jgi:hypothetical protein
MNADCTIDDVRLYPFAKDTSGGGREHRFKFDGTYQGIMLYPASDTYHAPHVPYQARVANIAWTLWAPNYDAMSCGIRIEVIVEGPNGTQTVRVLPSPSDPGNEMLASPVDCKGRPVGLTIGPDDTLKYRIFLNNNRANRSTWVIGSLIIDDVTIALVPQNPIFLYRTVQ